MEVRTMDKTEYCVWWFESTSFDTAMHKNAKL